MLNVNNRGLLTEDQRQLLDLWQGLFENPGWEIFARSAQEQLDGLEPAILDSLKDEALYIARGQRLTLKSIVDLPRLIEAEFNQLVGDAELAREEIEQSEYTQA